MQGGAREERDVERVLVVRESEHVVGSRGENQVV